MLFHTREDLVASLQHLAAISGLKLVDLHEFASRVHFTDDLLARLMTPDPAHPYGRNVIHACPMLECMVATWTRETPCAPHDHGGTFGAVRVLQGRAHHQIWDVADGALHEQRSHTVHSGDVLACGPSMVHSMGDAADEGVLVTLHLYTKAIDHMVVYDRSNQTTHVVEGTCGAWVPSLESGLIRSSVTGIHRRQDLTGA